MCGWSTGDREDVCVDGVQMIGKVCVCRWSTGNRDDVCVWMENG